MTDPFYPRVWLARSEDADARSWTCAVQFVAGGAPAQLDQVSTLDELYRRAQDHGAVRIVVPDDVYARMAVLNFAPDERPADIARPLGLSDG